MLSDRILDFSENREKEWKELKDKVGGGIELPLPDSERWFLAVVDGDGIRIETARKNVRPLTVYNPPTITFNEFVRVTNEYNDFFKPSVGMLDAKLDLQKSIANLRYIFVLIYNLL
ncbi:MAG: hypothetical protein ACT4NX_07815 [Deltaproteobacteria bacterium]